MNKKIRIKHKDHNHLIFNKKKNKKKIVLKKTKQFHLNNFMYNYKKRILQIQVKYWKRTEVWWKIFLILIMTLQIIIPREKPVTCWIKNKLENRCLK